MAAPTRFIPDRASDDPRFQYPCDECWQLTYDHCRGCGKRVCVNCNFAEQLGDALCMACYKETCGHFPYEHRVITYRVPIVRPHEALSLLHFLTVYEHALEAAAQAEAAMALAESHRLTREAIARDAAETEED